MLKLNNLLAAIGQQTGIVPPGQQDDIVISGRRPGADVSDADVGGPAPRSLGNRGFIEEQIAAAENVPERTGMFGMKGTLRDVLGVLGDAFLVQSGNDPVYRPQRERERMANAMAGHTADPLAAAERVGGLDPEMGHNMAKDYAAAMAREQQLQNQAANNESLADRRSWQTYDGGLEALGQLAHAGSQASPEVYQNYILPIMQRVKLNAGIGDEFVIPGQHDPNALSALATGGTPRTVQAQTRIEQGDRRIDINERQGDARLGIQQQNADTSARRASDSARLRQESNDIARQRADQAGSSQRSGRRSAPPPPPSDRFRGWSATPNN